MEGNVDRKSALPPSAS